jgi:hypothetical protein
MITLVHPCYGMKFVQPTEQLSNVHNDLMNGYMLVRDTTQAVYISVDQGVFWIRQSNASDELPKIRVSPGARHRANRATLSVPRKWITVSTRIDIGGTVQLSKLKLQASGFDPEYYSSKVELEHVLYQLSLGNTCLALPTTVNLVGYKGVYIYRHETHFKIRGGNSSERMPHIYANNGSLWVPKDFITTAAECCTSTEETTMDLVSLVMAEELYAVTVEFSKGGTPYTYKSQAEIAVGARVVVDSPTNGLVVVTVTGCSKGLDTSTTKFASYKWVVAVVDLTEYNRLRDLESSMIEKSKAKKRLDEARKQLEELGFTTEELIAMVKGND